MGTIILIILGINRLRIMPSVDTKLRIQSIIVVTSPMGENAPPAFAAKIIKEA